jgi:hypothetical protein
MPTEEQQKIADSNKKKKRKLKKLTSTLNYFLN